jgi:hypothetical protein
MDKLLPILGIMGQIIAILILLYISFLLIFKTEKIRNNNIFLRTVGIFLFIVVLLLLKGVTTIIQLLEFFGKH